MAGPRNPKFSILEIDGTELDIATEYEPQAEDIAFDNVGTGFAADTVQEALTEVGASASPGFSFGRSGNLSSGTWLRRPGNVPSNRAGVTIPIANPIITKISCSNRNIETYEVEIYEHEGNEVNLTLLATISITAARGGVFPVLVSATEGKQLAARLGNTAANNVRDVGVDIVLTGDNS